MQRREVFSGLGRGIVSQILIRKRTGVTENRLKLKANGGQYKEKNQGTALSRIDDWDKQDSVTCIKMAQTSMAQNA